MPEGDSYTRAADRLRPVLVDQTLTYVDGAPVVRKWSQKLVDHTVTGIRTHGKHLLFDVDSGVTIHVWLGMPGRWRIRDASGRTVAVESERRRGRRVRDPRGAARLILGTDHHEATCYSAPTVEIERTAVIDRIIERLGPDVLADEFDWELFGDRVSKVRPDRSVTDVLLDQRVLAGVGNEYKNEVLFLERLHPLTPFGSLDPDQIDALADRSRRLMLPNAHRSDRRTTGVRGAAMESWVFQRTGKPCRRCGTAIVSEPLGDPFPRITYWCPDCQGPREGTQTPGGTSPPMT
jgi:endonuclease-8